jgi:hypothetical protein
MHIFIEILFFDKVLPLRTFIDLQTYSSTVYRSFVMVLPEGADIAC